MRQMENRRKRQSEKERSRRWQVKHEVAEGEERKKCKAEKKSLHHEEKNKWLRIKSFTVKKSSKLLKKEKSNLAEP